MQTNPVQSSQLPLSVTPINASTQTVRSPLNESVAVNKSNEILVPDESQACDKCSTRKVIREETIIFLLGGVPILVK